MTGKKKGKGAAPAQPEPPSQVQDGEPKDAPSEEKKRVKVVATKMAFDGIKRIRRGETVVVEVPVDDAGNPILPSWAVTIDEWHSLREQEEEDAKRSNVKRSIRGGVNGQEL